LAAVAAFLISIAIVITFEMLFDRTNQSCRAAMAVLERAIAVDEDPTLHLFPTRELVAFQLSGPDVWYAVSQSGQTIEYGRERRPSVLPLSPTPTADGGSAGRKGILCLKVIPKGASELVLMSNSGIDAAGEIAKAFLERNFYPIFWIGFAFALIVLAGILFSARFVSNSIDRVTRFAMEIDPSAPGAAASLKEVPVELKPLVAALIKALKEIDAYVQAQRRFLSNAAHQLRTPLTMLRIKLEDVSESTLRADLIRDLRRLTSLVSAMLDLARLQNHAIEKKPFDLVVLARDVLVDFSPSALDAGIELALENDGTPVAPVWGAEVAVRSALSNLLTNALIHAKKARRIVVDVSSARVSISDDGEGIPAGLQTSILEPFQTGRSGNSGAGIGLSIVHEIMAAHGGTLHIESHHSKGTAVVLCFPPQVDKERSTSVDQENSLPHGNVASMMRREPAFPGLLSGF
jgi:signal transduction histidine kinase